METSNDPQNVKFWYEPLIDSGFLPDLFLRIAMRVILRDRAKELASTNVQEKENYIDIMKKRSVAEHVDKANEQHYEVSTKFMKLCLGKRMKYSCCLFPTGKETLDQAEDLMLESYCQKAQIEDGMDLLDLGCGWGSLCLFLCEKYPNAKITALSNSNSQREHIEDIARHHGFSNLKVVTANVADYMFDQTIKFDRILSIEMFEHMKNYEFLLEKVASWLKSDGLLFLHVFCHKNYPYDFVHDDSWMSKYFFTGGTMPSRDIFQHFQKDLIVVNQWDINGKHYAKTSEEWLKLLDRNKKKALPFLGETYGTENASVWFQRWRLFYIAVAEFFGMYNGDEWFVTHYLLKKREAEL